MVWARIVICRGRISSESGHYWKKRQSKFDHWARNWLVDHRWKKETSSSSSRRLIGPWNGWGYACGASGGGLWAWAGLRGRLENAKSVHRHGIDFKTFLTEYMVFYWLCVHGLGWFEFRMFRHLPLLLGYSKQSHLPKQSQAGERS